MKLLTSRWRNDTAAAAADAGHDPDMLSWHYRSRLDIHLADHTVFHCENLRAGCRGQTSARTDHGPATYSFVGATR